jgi:membrane-associated phospholipid phosphatase
MICLSLVATTLAAGGPVPRDFARQHANLWKSPFAKPGRTVKVALPLAGASAMLMIIDQPVINRYAQRPAPWAIKVSHTGDALTLAAGTVALYGIGRFTHHETTRQLGERSMLALANASLITQALKSATRRQRPDGSNHWSLPSGHAMTSFAVATALTSHPRSPRWLRIAAPVAASAIAFSRIGARKHYPTDIAIGSALGWFIGRSTR